MNVKVSQGIVILSWDFLICLFGAVSHNDSSVDTKGSKLSFPDSSIAVDNEYSDLSELLRDSYFEDDGYKCIVSDSETVYFGKLTLRPEPTLLDVLKSAEFKSIEEKYVSLVREFAQHRFGLYALLASQKSLTDVLAKLKLVCNAIRSDDYVAYMNSYVAKSDSNASRDYCVEAGLLKSKREKNNFSSFHRGMLSKDSQPQVRTHAVNYTMVRVILCAKLGWMNDEFNDMLYKASQDIIALRAGLIDCFEHHKGMPNIREELECQPLHKMLLQRLTELFFRNIRDKPVVEDANDAPKLSFSGLGRTGNQLTLNGYVDLMIYPSVNDGLISECIAAKNIKVPNGALAAGKGCEPVRDQAVIECAAIQCGAAAQGGAKPSVLVADDFFASFLVLGFSFTNDDGSKQTRLIMSYRTVKAKDNILLNLLLLVPLTLKEWSTVFETRIEDNSFLDQLKETAGGGGPPSSELGPNRSDNRSSSGASGVGDRGVGLKRKLDSNSGAGQGDIKNKKTTRQALASFNPNAPRSVTFGSNTIYEI